MGQRPSLFIFLALAASITIGCERDSTPGAPPAVTTTRPSTVASLSPAATEILIGLGFRDRLVAVSNFEPQRDAVKGLPHVGDYQSSDWERLASLRPSVMVTQFAADRLPAGLVQKAEGLNIRLVNVPITRLDDIGSAMTTLGDAMGDYGRGRGGREALERQLEAIRAKSAGAKIRALIVVDESARGAVGRDNYLNDLLELVGGENVIRPGGPPYPTIDREALIAMDPQVIFQLLPSASEQVQAKSKQLWESMPQLQAVRNRRVHLCTDLYALQPSQHVIELAERFAVALAEARKATTKQATNPLAPVRRGDGIRELPPRPGTPGRGLGRGASDVNQSIRGRMPNSFANQRSFTFTRTLPLSLTLCPEYSGEGTRAHIQPVGSP